MKHSRLSSNIGFPLFVLILIASLTVGTGACTNLGSDDDSSNTSDAPTETKVSTNDQGRIPADYILFRDDFQDGDTQGWRIDGAWVVPAERRPLHLRHQRAGLRLRSRRHRLGG